MTDLRAVLSPGVLQALEALIDERVERALAAHGDTVNGSTHGSPSVRQPNAYTSPSGQWRG